MERSKIIIGILFAFICSTQAVLAQEPIKTDVPFVPTDQQVVDAPGLIAEILVQGRRERERERGR